MYINPEKKSVPTHHHDSSVFHHRNVKGGAPFILEQRGRSPNDEVLMICQPFSLKFGTISLPTINHDYCSHYQPL